MISRLVIKSIFAVAVFCTPCLSLDFKPPAQSSRELVKITVESQYASLGPQTASSALAIHFDVNEAWHFYPDPKHAPGSMNLQLEANEPSGSIIFKDAILPPGTPYTDPLANTTVDIITGRFTVYLPFEVKNHSPGDLPIELKFKGALCSADQCRMWNKKVDSSISLAAQTAGDPKFSVPAQSSATVKESQPQLVKQYSALTALLLAFAAGLLLNIMPCVLPVIPLKVLGIFEHAKESMRRCELLGLAFCLGIIAFFGLIAAVNIVLRVSYASVFQWGDHFRSPVFVIGMALLMEFLALVMFGIIHIHLPGSIANNASPKGGYLGSIGMGFLAALLSTPCSFAILTAAFAWAQLQPLWLSTITILVIGVGMALPYGILTSMPWLLRHLPKPGHWMEVFKQALGFMLLIVAVWLVSILPAQSIQAVLYFSVILALGCWMWGSWLHYDSPLPKKVIVRTLAVILVLSGGVYLLSEPVKGSSASAPAKWTDYDPALIKSALAQGRPVLIDWTADWCLTCKALEKTVLSRKDIQELIAAKNVLAIRADTTWASNPASIDLAKVYNEPGVPVIMIFEPGSGEPRRLHGLLIADQLKQTLQNLRDDYGKENSQKALDQGR